MITASSTETITAVATPPGVGGVGIVRISGPESFVIAEAISGALPPVRMAGYRTFHDASGTAIDQGIVLTFSAPHSFTGEDVVELQGHGGPVVMDLLVKRTLELGARLARPGEFSERAFLNGKIDLVQAEAIADLIDAASAAAVRSATHSLQGAFSRLVNALVEDLIRLRMYVEAAIDFPEEEVDFLSENKVSEGLLSLKASIEDLRTNARTGVLLRDGMRLVIAGRPNVGKSSLLNALAGRETAIVTELPGTTRDVLREHIQIDGMPLHLVDTAGLRDTADRVEREGIRRAHAELAVADLILWMCDDREGSSEADILNAGLPPDIPVLVVRNKIDLSGAQPGLRDAAGRKELALSARTGEGLAQLRTHLKHCMGFESPHEGAFIARRRHLDAIVRAAASLTAAERALVDRAAGELVAEELRQAQNALSEITGAVSADDLLGRIFASFCIGK